MKLLPPPPCTTTALSSNLLSFSPFTGKTLSGISLQVPLELILKLFLPLTEQLREGRNHLLLSQIKSLTTWNVFLVRQTMLIRNVQKAFIASLTLFNISTLIKSLMLKALGPSCLSSA